MDKFQVVEPTISDMRKATPNPTLECERCGWQIKATETSNSRCSVCDRAFMSVDAILAGKKMSDIDAAELAGRIYEAIDIVLAIERGQFTTLQDVHTYVQARAKFIQKKMEAASIPMARSIGMDEFKRQESDC